ncbi:transmembrane protein 183-like [Antedon mediterranea]|uniref:transmembrane protein 183-like n=1 Tax=Antedon mediterranea TaxID=105859 RepID=UPI003AF426E5
MHNKKRKNNRQCRRHPAKFHVMSKIQEGSITLNDYANTSTAYSSDRNVKKLNCSITKKVKSMDIVDVTQKKLQENLNWYEKNFDDEFEIENLEELDVIEDERLDVNSNVQPNVVHHEEAMVSEGLVYPPDIWFQLSKYIAPEDVWRFACLCHDACAVTNTVAFWRSLYLRHRDPKIKLPQSLSKELIEGTYGVRYITICALYLMYEPLRRKTVINSPIGEGTVSPYSLKNQICKYIWSQGNPGAEFTYYLMFEEHVSKKNKPLQFDKDIYASNYSYQTILKVFCRSYQNLPQAEIMGLQLADVFFNVSGDMRNHKLRLVFQSERTRRRGNPSLTTTVLDPVVWVRIIHWWHPQFRNCIECIK